MPAHAVTCQFQRDPGSERLASTPVEADAEAVLFSWTDQEGRGYEVLLRGGDRLVATLRFDAQERDVATEELHLQCRALGLVWEAATSASGEGVSVAEEIPLPGVDHHGH
ncbi:hypothetical protein [Acidovorax sp.]|uniref:hypothetical protein n=1 Tax=Acidovorax sp. TaxID=1872122 RepID=UPI002ACEB34B|nr:hypothetical protein [Acidovorax sp.]MDZ7865761.1 hypothetical protein [Acidovorax sp.]